MSKHFEYMFRQRDESFFDKVASEAPKDSASNERLEKDLEFDIQLLKTSGPVGDGFAFTKRACAYLNMLADESNPNLAFFPTAFEKVASAAIQADVHAMLPGLDKEARLMLLHEAQELVKKAEAEKQAGGVSALFKGLGEAGKVMAHGGGEAALKAIKAPVRGAANVAQKAVRGLEDARLGAASRSAKKLQLGADAAKGSAAAAEGPIGKAFHGGRAESLQGSATKAMDSRDKKLTNMVGGRAKKLVPDVAGNVAKTAPKAAPKIEAAKIETPKVEPTGETAIAKAEHSVPAAAGGGDKKPSTTIEAFHKARKHGWHTLDDLEKQKLITGGLATGLAANVALNN